MSRFFITFVASKQNTIKICNYLNLNSQYRNLKSSSSRPKKYRRRGA